MRLFVQLDQAPQVSIADGVYWDMEAAPQLTVLETVRCLECSGIYAKPGAGGTSRENPGCPSCGYVGWIPVTLPAEPRVRTRYVVDQRPRLIARSR